MTTPFTPPIGLSSIKVRQAPSGPATSVVAGDISWGYGTILRSNDLSSTEYAAQAQVYTSGDPPIFLLNYDGDPMETFIVSPKPDKHYRMACDFAVLLPGTLQGDLSYSINVSRDGGLVWIPYSTTVQQMGKTGDATDQWVWCRINTGWKLGSAFGVQDGDAEIRARISFQAALS